MWMAEKAKTELRDFRQPLLLPYRWLKRPVPDIHGSPTLTPGHERKTLEQTVIVHCDKWEASEAGGGRSRKERTVWTCWGGNKETAYEDAIPSTDISLSLFSDTESNEYNGQLTYRSLNMYTGFPIYSKQCSTARLYKPFDKKISSFLWYGQWRVPGGNALSLVHGSSGGRIHIRCEPSVSLLAHTDALLLL